MRAREQHSRHFTPWLGTGLIWDDVYAKLVVRWIQSVTCS